MDKQELKRLFDTGQLGGVFPPVEAFVSLVEENAKEGMVVAELGVFDGATTRYVLPTIKKFNGKYYAVDWFNGTDESYLGINHSEPYQNGVRHYYREGYDELVYPLFLNLIEETGCQDICITIKEKTIDAAKFIPDKSLDICFIDAAHDYLNVKQDIETYLPKMKDGGIICGHDYDSDFSHRGVVLAVNEAFSDIEIRPCKTNTPPIWIKRL